MKWNDLLLVVLLTLCMLLGASCTMEIKDSSTEVTAGGNEEVTEPQETPEPTCEDIEMSFDEIMLPPADCDTASPYLDDLIEGACMEGAPMDLITKILSFTGAGCDATCIQRAALASAYMDVGDFMASAIQINLISGSGLCVDICLEITDEYLDRGGMPGALTDPTCS